MNGDMDSVRTVLPLSFQRGRPRGPNKHFSETAGKFKESQLKLPSQKINLHLLNITETLRHNVITDFNIFNIKEAKNKLNVGQPY